MWCRVDRLDFDAQFHVTKATEGSKAPLAIQSSVLLSLLAPQQYCGYAPICTARPRMTGSALRYIPHFDAFLLSLLLRMPLEPVFGQDSTARYKTVSSSV